jgi:hypothetical protein
MVEATLLISCHILNRVHTKNKKKTPYEEYIIENIIRMPSVTCKADILTGPIFQVQVGIPSPLTESGRCRMASFGRPIGPSLGAKANRHSSVA